jgi:hypothetical protein
MIMDTSWVIYINVIQSISADIFALCEKHLSGIKVIDTHQRRK